MLCGEPTVRRNRLDFRSLLFWCWTISKYYEGNTEKENNYSVVFK
jgi:hypothetical protein